MPTLRLNVPTFASTTPGGGWSFYPEQVARNDAMDFPIEETDAGVPVIHFEDGYLLHWHGRYWRPLDHGADPAKAFETALLRRLLPPERISTHFALIGGRAALAQPCPAWVVRVFEWRQMMVRYERTPPEVTTAAAEPFVLFAPDQGAAAKDYAQAVGAQLGIKALREFLLPVGRVLRPDLLPDDWVDRSARLQMPCILQNAHAAMTSLPSGAIENWLALRSSIHPRSDDLLRFVRGLGTAGPVFGTDIRKWRRRASVAALLLAGILPKDEPEEGDLPA